MTCARFRTAISARLDGEHVEGPERVDPDALRAHLDHCADCRAFAGGAERLHGAVRVAPAPDVPDLTPGILAAIDGLPRRRRAGRTRVPVPRGARAPLSQEGVLRLILVAVAAIQIGVAVPALVLGSDAGLPVHAARHLGSFDVAVAVGFLFAAWRPARISGILPIGAALVVCLVGSSALDLVQGTTGAGSEAHHATDVAGLVVVWLLSRSVVAPGVAPPGRRMQVA
jgi:predicted anti-sigma-YlaC factor YlaD